jgi:hypothetical protein
MMMNELRPHRKKEPRPQDHMLADFLRAPTAEAKRAVIERFAPLYFLLTPTKENLNESKES